MAHKFNPSMLEKLEDPSRLEIFHPEVVQNKFGLKEGMSKLVGEKGRVYKVLLPQKYILRMRSRII